MYFGGLPLASDGASMVVDRQTPEQLERLKQMREQPKKFSTEAFLDLYMQEKSKPLTTFEEVE